MTAPALVLVALAFFSSTEPTRPTQAGAPAGAIPLAEAAAAFEVARETCERDAGALWGKSLCGPILLVDPATREVVASAADGEGRLRTTDGLFVGQLPVEVSPANTALEWAGVRWTMVLWPLPEDSAERARLLVHELFHRVQADLRLPANNPANAHLDTEAGRFWLQLELRALAFALETPAHHGRKRALTDALAFRRQRWNLFPAARDEEVALEKNEGLAEYTGGVLTGAEAGRRLALANLHAAPERPSFVRSFAYATGPVYGLFLDSLRPRWRREIPNRGLDFGRLLSLSLGFTLDEWSALASSALERAERYGGTALYAAELRRSEERARRLGELRARLVDGPVLRLDFRRMNITFDPGELVPIVGEGTVYPAARITDDWGILTVESGGALLDDSWSSVRVAARKKPRLRQGVLRGEGWTLELAAGWRLTGRRKTGWRLIPEAPR